MSAFLALDFWMYVLVLAGIYAIFSLGLQVQYGVAGLLNFGHVGMMALSSYSLAILVIKVGLNTWLACVVAVAIAALGGALLGLTTLRLRGDYFAIVTTAFSEIVRYVANNQRGLTGGTEGSIAITGKNGLNSFSDTFENFRSKFQDFLQHIIGDYAQNRDTQMAILIWLLAFVLLFLVGRLEKTVPLELQKSATYARLLSSSIAIHYLRGDYIRANDISQNAMAIFDDQTDPVARASIYWNASLAADAVQDSTRALLLAQRAAGLFSESDEALTEGTLRVAIAWLLTRQTPPDVDGARLQLERAHILLTEHGTTVDITYYQIELARVEWLSGNHEEALQICTLAIANTDPMKDRLQRADAYLLAARSQISLGHKADSSMNLLAARGSLLEMEPSRQNALAWRELGDIYSGLGHLEDAIDAYREALQEAGVPASPLAFSEFQRAKEKIAIRKNN